MADIPEDTLKTARGMLAATARGIIGSGELASLTDQQRESLFQKTLQALDFAYQEGYGDADERADEALDDQEDESKL